MEEAQILDKHGNPVEPSFYERLFFIERFYRKHKKSILGIVSVSVIGGLGYGINSFWQDYQLDIINEAYYNYSHDIEPEKNLEIIANKNEKLYSLIKFSETIKAGGEIQTGNHRILKDIAEFQKLSENRDSVGLNNYSYKDGAIYRDLAIVLEAYSLIQTGKNVEAKDRLAFIEETSSLKDLTNYLNHFGVVSTSNINNSQIVPTLPINLLDIKIEGVNGSAIK